MRRTATHAAVARGAGHVGEAPDGVETPNRLVIDLAAISENVAAIRRVIGPSVVLFASLKADAYGYGAREVAAVAVAAGADALATGDLVQALALRAAHPRIPILCYHSSPVDAVAVRTAERARIAMTIVDHASAEAYAAAANDRLDVFVKVDVGLCRLGVAVHEAVDVLRSVAEQRRLQLRGAYTHLHTPPEADDAYLRRQVVTFAEAIQAARSGGTDVPLAMAASSGVMERLTGVELDAVDPGRALYGLTALASAAPSHPSRPALLALETRLVQVKRLSHGDYDQAMHTEFHAGMRLGIIPMGRWHGLDTVSSGTVLVHGHRVAIVGQISIEHARLDLSSVPNAKAGDPVVIIGSQGRSSVTIEEVIAATGCVGPVDITLRTGQRIGRVYRAG